MFINKVHDIGDENLGCQIQIDDAREVVSRTYIDE